MSDVTHHMRLLSKNIIDAYSDDENEMNNAAPVPTSSEMRTIMKNKACRQMNQGRFLLLDFAQGAPVFLTVRSCSLPLLYGFVDYCRSCCIVRHAD
ncbi:hypothetical protein TNCV_1844251 [Trichonephila clavipes]|nr:hypothetical protein TNCV_1844251 [Trichonephila clavipes]